MAKMSNIANEMAKKFISEKNKRYGLNKIMYDVNYLVYRGTNQPLSYKDKAAIVMYIFDLVAGRRQLKVKEGEDVVVNFSDVVIFFERRDFILKHLRAGVMKQAELN